MVSTCCTDQDMAFASPCPPSANEGHRGLEPCSWLRAMPQHSPSSGRVPGKGTVGRWPRTLPLVTLWLHSVPRHPLLTQRSAQVIKANSLEAAMPSLPVGTGAGGRRTRPRPRPMGRTQPGSLLPWARPSSCSAKPRRLPAPLSCGRCHINISQVLSNTGRPPALPGLPLHRIRLTPPICSSEHLSGHCHAGGWG